MTTTADLVVLGDTEMDLNRAADPAGYVIQVCERAKTWLALALDHGDIDAIVELKSQVEAIRIYTMQKQLGKDAQLSATEIVRRAERGIGIAIRRGQEAGEIRARGMNTRTDLDQAVANGLVSPSDYVSADELSGNNGNGIYGITDNITDEQFDCAVEDAKEALDMGNALASAAESLQQGALQEVRRVEVVQVLPDLVAMRDAQGGLRIVGSDVVPGITPGTGRARAVLMVNRRDGLVLYHLAGSREDLLAAAERAVEDPSSAAWEWVQGEWQVSLLAEALTAAVAGAGVEA